MYVNFTAGDKDYKLRLSTKQTVELEKKLGCNPLMIFGTDSERLPTVTEMVCILYHSMQQLNHGISLTDTYDIFDAYLADGNAPTDFISVIFDIYKASGLIKSDTTESEKDEKNE